MRTRQLVLVLSLMALGTAVAVATLDGSAAAGTSSREATPPSAKQVATLRKQIARLKAELTRTRALTPAGIAATLARVKTLNDRYRSVEQAKAAGYIQRSPCESSPEGGMGFHFVNDEAMRDPQVDPNKPEILVFGPGSSGLELVAAEYWKADADQNLATDADRPTLFGRAFDGPMEGHNPPGTLPGTGMPRHYDLHLWFWKRNPSGLFAPWNPDLRCS